MTEEADLIAGRYRLGAEVGSGGMGVVWRARDEVLGRTVALKALTPRSIADDSRDDESARRAMREARIAARLHHPNVIGIYDVVEHEGRPFLIMEFLASRSLSEIQAAEELLAPREAARIGALLAAGLTAAHKAGIVHRDVKPGNVLLAPDGTVKLTDFGISRAIGDTSVTASGVLLGTLAYIAPEVGRGESADSRSDVYSLGATLYAAVEGKPPFGTDDNAIALLYRIVHEDIALPRNAGPLAPVLLWMLERDPDMRPTMPQVQRALEAIEAAHDDEPTVEDERPAAPVVSPEPEAAAPTPAAPESIPAPVPMPAPAPAATPEVAPAPPPSPAEDEKPAATPPSGPSANNKRRAVIAALAAALVLAIVAVVLTQRTGDHPAASSTSPSGSHSATATHTPAATHPASASAQSSATASAAAGSSASTAASAPASASQDLASQLRTTIIDYYQLMPGNLDQGWPWMTADYQTNHAGGRIGYQDFWTQIQRVTVFGVTATPPSTVVATIDYYYKNGTISEERTSFGLVFEQGRWKIASSSVFSRTSK